MFIFYEKKPDRPFPCAFSLQTRSSDFIGFVTRCCGLPPSYCINIDAWSQISLFIYSSTTGGRNAGEGLFNGETGSKREKRAQEERCTAFRKGCVLLVAGRCTASVGLVTLLLASENIPKRSSQVLVTQSEALLGGAGAFPLVLPFFCTSIKMKHTKDWGGGATINARLHCIRCMNVCHSPQEFAWNKGSGDEERE